MSFINKMTDKIMSQDATAKEVARVIKGREIYLAPEPGDIFFHFYEEPYEINHVNMIAPDRTQKIDSVYGMDDDTGKIDADSGPRIFPLSKDKHSSLAFRFHKPNIAYQAAQLAKSWVGKVGYSDSANDTFTSRQISLTFGSCNWGRGARGRLDKYKSREHKNPKNVTCPELCILVYQLNLSETDAAFPKLDAKHSSPNTLFRYVANSPYWKYVGRRR